MLVGAASLPEWYARWGPHFEEVERGAARIDDLEIDLDDAIAEENYSAAARIKAEIEQLDGRDLFLTLEDAMEQAIAEERYEDAARIRDATMMNLVGWWRGRFETDTEASSLFLPPPLRSLPFVSHDTSFCAVLLKKK